MNGRTPGKVLMVQGTTSHAGKSVLVTALCRIFSQDGYSVAPFKAQNMSLNSYATPDGGEIGRAQAVQAEAAGMAASVDMNPILLKPEADHRSQVVVLGRPTGTATAREYYTKKQQLWPVVTGALDRLRSMYDVVVIEGAGSPAEINLKEHEIVNMRVARYAQAPVLLVGDIDRGGVFAHLVGTMMLLDPDERVLVKGLVINKFRGDPSLLDPGIATLREKTGAVVMGVLPYFTDIHIPQEDSLGLEEQSPSTGAAVLDVVVVRLPHIANFDDFDPLRREPGVRVRFVSTAPEMDAPDLIVLPGTKTTVNDLTWLRKQGLDAKVVEQRRRGTPVIGVCGGYQMLGSRILDPQRVESNEHEVHGLGLLPVETVFGGEKTTEQVMATVAVSKGLLAGCHGVAIRAYEIHMGHTQGKGEAPHRVVQRSGVAAWGEDGCMDEEGKTLGTYMHGLFHNTALRRGILGQIASWKGVSLPAPGTGYDPELEYDKLAGFMRKHLDMERIYRMTGLKT